MSVIFTYTLLLNSSTNVVLCKIKKNCSETKSQNHYNKAKIIKIEYLI